MNPETNGNVLMTIKGERSSATLLLPKSIEEFPHPKEIRLGKGWYRPVPWNQAPLEARERVYARYLKKHYQRAGLCVRAFMAKPKKRRKRREKVRVTGG